MSWKLKALLIWGLAVPAFSGFPINYMAADLLVGISYGWVIYAMVVHGAIILLLSRKIYKITIVVAVVITIPLVLLGTLISLIGLVFSGWDSALLADVFSHYSNLMATMLVVIPLALAMVAVLPFHRLEHHILKSRGGVRIGEKMILMFLRVFSHILYFVIPNIFEVIREERMLPSISGLTAGHKNNNLPLSERTRNVIQALINIGVESICSSIRYVPFWAEEISRLPGYSGAKQKPGGGKSPQD